MAASASTSTLADPVDTYSCDVFINHHGPDSKKTLASHLYRRFLAHGVRAFLDQEELQVGVNFNSQIKEAIRTASIHVAIFSPRYAESKWCLDELVLMLESGAPIIPVFYHVKPAELRWTGVKDRGYAQALQKLEMKKTYNSETHQENPRYDSTTIENWRNALSSVADISGLDLEAFNGDEGELLDKVVERVMKKGRKIGLYVAKYPIGLDDTVKDLETTVPLQQHSGRVQIVGITGLGGVGKTTLAKELFNRKSSNYSKSYFLFDVRENAKISLQSKLLKAITQMDLHVDSIDHGIEMLRKHLSSSQVFVVLDDVDHVDQVESLLPVDVLRPGSLVLITSRDKTVLARSGVQESSIYKLSGLNTERSRELFCSHAFCQPHPLTGFEYLVNKIIKACDGLPLSLKVFGGLLYGNRDTCYWEDQLDRLQQILPDEIQKRLHISYDALQRDKQQIFLDIACFFIGEKKDTAIRIWDGSDCKGMLVFQNLQNKCLVEVDEVGREKLIKMHDHLRDMGRDIASASGLQRNMWGWRENINDLLQQLSVTTEVRGIRMLRMLPSEYDGREYQDWIYEDREDSDDEYASLSCYKTRKLQFLDTEDGLVERILSRVRSPNLIWLRWYKCPYSSLPSWIPMKNLRVLQVHSGRLETLWQAESEAPLNLRELEICAPPLNIPKSIQQCKHLERIVITAPSILGYHNSGKFPEEFCQLPMLKHLEFKSLSRSLPDSFGNLTNLEHINLSESYGLERLPNSFGNLRRLKYLDLGYCYNITISSETLGNISTLEYINLSDCRKIEVLPSQFAHQPSLEKMVLGLEKLKELPTDIGELSDLEDLELESSHLLETLPPSVGDLRNLKYLTLRRCYKLNYLPDSIGQLNELTKLVVYLCPLRKLPFKKVEGETETLTESRGRRTMSRLDSSIDKCMLPQLQHLQLDYTQLSEVSFPPGVCPNLQHLHIWGCDFLTEVGTLPNALRELWLTNCSNLRKIERLCGLAKLQKLNISNCKVEDLPSIETLVSLEELEACGCRNLKSLKGLAQLAKLRLLNVRECSEFEELPGLEHLRSLEELQASKCVKLKSIWDLAQLTKLRVLCVSYCSELEELPGVEHLSSLEMLDASECVKLNSIKGLAQLTQLQKLNVSGCSELQELRGLEHLGSLEELQASKCAKLKSIRASRQLAKLRFLYVDYCSELEELPGIEHVRSLERLYAVECPKLQWRGGVVEQLCQRLKGGLTTGSIRKPRISER